MNDFKYLKNDPYHYRGGFPSGKLCQVVKHGRNGEVHQPKKKAKSDKSVMGRKRSTKEKKKTTLPVI